MATPEDLSKIVTEMRKKDEEDIYWRKYFDNKDINDEKYMSDMANWVCAHVTKYMPKRNKSGKLYIPTTAMVTGNKLPRSTVHVTLNQIVRSHMLGSWDSMPIVVLAPYNDVVKENGNPSQIATEDTYFVPNPDSGLILPENTCIVKPDNSSLFHIGDNVATYKTDHFTTKEIKTILSLLDPYEYQKYEKYAIRDAKQHDIDSILGYNKKWKKVYDNLENKDAFVWGILEEDRYIILTHFLRDIIARAMMEKMGYNFVFSHEDNISACVANVARNVGISGDSGNKGHSGSLERQLEETGCVLSQSLDAFESLTIDGIYDKLMCCDKQIEDLLHFFSQDTIPDFYNVYQESFNDVMEHAIYWTQYEINMVLEYHKQYNDSLEKLPELQEELERFQKLKDGGISVYNPRLDIVLRRNASRLTQQYNRTANKLKQNPKYPELTQRLSEYFSEDVCVNQR